MKHVLNNTTLRYPRTLRKTGTEMAGCIEHYRRTDIDGITIVFVVALVLLLSLVGSWVGSFILEVL